MEQKDMMLTLRGEQRVDGEVHQTTHTVPCTLEITEEGAVVRYREAAEAGLGETESVLRLGEAEAVLERTGDTRTRMRFVVGQRHRVDYETAAGALRLEVRTTFLSHNVTAAGGKAMIRYHLSSGGETVANHTLKLNIEERAR